MPCVHNPAPEINWTEVIFRRMGLPGYTSILEFQEAVNRFTVVTETSTTSIRQVQTALMEVTGYRYTVD